MRSSYLERAAEDASILGDRPTMTALFTADARLHSRPAPPRAPSADLRIAQWNVNILQGIDMRTPAPTHVIGGALVDLNADVLLLQEAGIQTFPDAPVFKSGPFADIRQEAVNARLDDLHAFLRARGYACDELRAAHSRRMRRPNVTASTRRWLRRASPSSASSRPRFHSTWAQPAPRCAVRRVERLARHAP